MERDDYGKYILVPIDFADYSVKAAYLAFELAALWGSEIVFLHTFDDSSTKRTVLELTEKLKALFDSERASGRFASVVYSVVIKKGVPEDEIKKFVKTNNPRLIVMGTRANDQKVDELIGSVTSEVLSFTTVPLIVVPDSSPIKSYASVRNVCYATNFTDKDIYVFDDLMQRLKRYDFNVSFVHVLENNESAAAMQPAIDAFQKSVDSKYPSLKKKIAMLPCEKDVPYTLDKYMKDHGMDILTVKMSSGRGFYNMFVISLAQQLVYSAKNPLLVLPYMPQNVNKEKQSDTAKKLMSLHRNMARVNFFNRKRV